ncbi:MAG: hypothetical protein SOZ34_09940 [Clostridia bacterium]|nr:hypothetical protein [Clostridia bacterium]
MISFIEYLNVPARIAICIVGIFFVLQIIGELLEFKGKVVPEFIKIRKYFARKKKEKAETAQTLKDVKILLNDVNAHYSTDNISRRNGWMSWVNDRAETHEEMIDKLRETLSEVTQALKDNTKMTEEMFVQSSRDRIIDFANKAGDENAVVSREEFNRIFKVHKKYEDFLEEHSMTNGEVDIAYRIIKDSYERHMRNHNFVEDIRGYNE